MIISIMFYLTVFVFSIICFYISEHLPIYQKKYSGIIALIGILIICLVAGLRGYDVGVDVKVYIIKSCTIAKNFNNIWDLFNATSINIGSEYIYGILLYICTRFNYSVQLLLFAIQLFTIWPIYKACKIIKNKYYDFSITLAMTTYIFLYFNNTLNMMRQSISIAFIILGVAYMVVNKNKLKGWISFIIAIFAHKSGFIGIILLLLLMYLFKNKKSLKKVFVILLNIAIVSIPIGIQSLYNLMIRFGINNDHFDFYNDVFITKKVDKEWFTNPFSTYSLSFLVFVAIFAIFLIFSKIKSNKNKNTEKREDMLLFSNIVLYGYLIYIVILFSFKTMYGLRISMFLDMFNIIALPLCVACNKKYLPVIYVAQIICWFVLIMKLGWSGSNIYTFFD